MMLRNINKVELKTKLYDIIFESDTIAGKTFDIILMLCISLSVIIAIFGSTFPAGWMRTCSIVLEYVFTVFFTLEYILRIYCSPNPRYYIFSFFGIVDLLSILPMYLGIFVTNAHYGIILRSLRLIRVFRVMKLFNFLSEGNVLLNSLYASSRKILVFFLFVLLLVICIGAVMFMVEGNQPNTMFENVPKSIYWAIVTLTTVGYGDITPTTSLGRFLSAVVMLMGYTIIAVPTGIVSAQMISMRERNINRRCPNCGRSGHELDSKYCKHCGSDLEDDDTENHKSSK